MPYTRLLVHAVWAVKNRLPLLKSHLKSDLCQHIREYSKTKNIYLINVNGGEDHIHCLISLTSDQNIATVMNLIKGESSYWANRNLKLSQKFGWQDEYFAVSVSQSHLGMINNYINKQEKHHKRKSFEQEYSEFIENYNFDIK